MLKTTITGARYCRFRGTPYAGFLVTSITLVLTAALSVVLTISYTGPGPVE